MKYKIAYPTKHVMQEDPWGCAIACHAMAFGLTYAEAYEVMGDLCDPEKNGGTPGLRDEAKALQRFGLESEYENGRSVGDFCVTHRGFYISPEYFLFTVWGRPAFLSVPSLNIENGWHMVYTNGCKLFDPVMGREGKRWYRSFEELKPDYITIFKWQVGQEA